MKKLLEALEEADISWSRYSEGGETSEDERYYAEFEFYSDAGEDFVYTVDYDGTADGFVRAYREYTDRFEPQEHAKGWISCMEKDPSVPQDIYVLIRDAEEIKRKLEKTASMLERLAGGKPMQQKKRKPFEWAEYPVSEDILDTVLAQQEDFDGDVDLAGYIAQLVSCDDAPEPYKIASMYKFASADERRIIDAFCVHLCGYSFATICNSYAKQCIQTKKELTRKEAENE